MDVFKNYSKYYNLLYKDKDYEAESNYVESIIKKYAPEAKQILELGCGTGKHASILADKGFIVHGVDLSDTMLDEAYKLENVNLSFKHGDVRNYRANKKFDVVTSLFHVINYQTENIDLEAMFETVFWHLNSGGIFIFDAWYGPAVLNFKPEKRIKILEDDFLKVERTANPEIYLNENVVDVNYNINIIDKLTNETDIIQETHKVRYLFKPELEYFMDKNGFKLIEAKEWLTSAEPSEDTWGVCFVGIKK